MATYQKRKGKFVRVYLPDRRCGEDSTALDDTRIVFLSDPTLPDQLGAGENTFITKCESLYKIKQPIAKYVLNVPAVGVVNREFTNINPTDNSCVISVTLIDTSDFIDVSIYAEDVVGNTSNVITKKIAPSPPFIEPPVILVPVNDAIINSLTELTVTLDSIKVHGGTDTPQAVDYKICKNRFGTGVVTEVTVTTANPLTHTFTGLSLDPGSVYYIFARVKGRKYDYSDWSYVFISTNI